MSGSETLKTGPVLFGDLDGSIGRGCGAEYAPLFLAGSEVGVAYLLVVGPGPGLFRTRSRTQLPCIVSPIKFNSFLAFVSCEFVWGLCACALIPEERRGEVGLSLCARFDKT